MANEVNKKYQIDTEENKQFLRENAETLLAFGHKFPSSGGGSYYLGDDGTPWKDRNRETWITCRMAHVYSLGVMLGHDGSEQLVDAALKGLTGEMHDDINGGWYAGLTKDGVLCTCICTSGSIQCHAGKKTGGKAAFGGSTCAL